MCNTQQFMFLTMLIPGPKGPKKEIDVYLEPLIEELQLLWNEGVETYDASSKTNFTMRASLLWTISDFPAYAMLSGWSTHGKLACPYCMDETKTFYLKNSGKCSFFDCHRWFLPERQLFWRQKDKFLKRIEKMHRLNVSMDRSYNRTCHWRTTLFSEKVTIKGNCQILERRRIGQREVFSSNYHIGVHYFLSQSWRHAYWKKCFRQHFQHGYECKDEDKE